MQLEKTKKSKRLILEILLKQKIFFLLNTLKMVLIKYKFYPFKHISLLINLFFSVQSYRYFSKISLTFDWDFLRLKKKWLLYDLLIFSLNRFYARFIVIQKVETISILRQKRKKNIRINREIYWMGFVISCIKYNNENNLG